MIDEAPDVQEQCQESGQESGQELIAAANSVMPFGRFCGTRLIDLPEPYLVWFQREGFPDGQLGLRMALMLEIKINGLEKLVRPLLEPLASDDMHES